MAIKEKYVEFQQDKKGMLWDLALYVPTVIFLASYGAKLWFSGNQTFTYVLVFAASYFFIAGANRILKVRMMLLSASPISINANKQRILLTLRNGEKLELAKNVRFYTDYVGKNFAISGMDSSGKKQQYVFSRGQFPSDSEYSEMKDFLRIFA